MRPLHFDPFGEPVAQDLRSLPATPPGKASRIALRSGVGLFWILVVGIMAARVAYFEPDFDKAFASVAAFKSYVQTLFSA